MHRINDSIIVPMYNEEKRVPFFLSKLLKYCKDNLKSYEIIAINDGSEDNTKHIVENLIKGNRNVRLLSYSRNKGKGYAVKKGVFASKGEKIIFIDADGSIRPEEIQEMLIKLDSYDVVVGNRSLKHSIVKKPLIKKILGKLFDTYVCLLFNTKVSDHLCGFKGFRRETINNLFGNLVCDGWIFDVELFYKIRKFKYKLYEKPIKWEYRYGSKMRIFDPLTMFFQLIKLKLILVKEDINKK